LPTLTEWCKHDLVGISAERAAFSSLALRLATLPLVICGPILRRTETDKVSVWIAFRRAVSDIQLRIYDSPNPDQQATPLLVSARTATFALGDNLFVALVTADQGTTPVIRLSPQQIYGYDVILGSEGDVGLGAPGILNAPGNADGEIGRIAYGTYALPSFVIPASTVPGLKLVHGSCRMPHGGRTDGLRALDSILTGLHADPVNRPQQLFLTGDQIYADDVADPLLHMLIDAESALLGWLEPLPGNPPADGLKVGHRAQTVRDAGFTTTAGKSHLIRLGEYYAMYLMVWSDVLWPDDPPGFAEVHPDLPTHEVRGIARAGTIRIETMKYAGFNRERARIVEFRRSLGFARKALANIASYMVFDDHEVTDDWFLEGGWSQRVITEPLTRRIVQNGLSAFGVFQAWGNLPTEFGPLLQRLATVHAGRGLRLPDWAAVGAGVLPVVATGAGGQIELTGGPRWNYLIEFEAHRLIALDTRSRRSFATANSPPCLVGGADLATQIPLPGSPKELTVLVSGAPVVGHPMLEEVVQPILREVKDAGYADYEFWTARADCFEDLLDRLTPFRRVLMLSGDVHYGFSVAVHYWNKRTGTTLPAIFVQLCSSALSNEDGKTNLLANRLLKPDLMAEFVGWSTPGRHVSVEGQDGGFVVLWVGGKTGVHKRRLLGPIPVDFLEDPADWSYRVLFQRDGRDAAQRGIPGFGSLPAQPQEALGYLHRWRQKWEAHRTVVGRDNFGSIFVEDADGRLKVFHELWYAPEDPATSLLRPYTRHAITLEVPPVNEAPS
jgi:hypothetical protein